MLISHKFYWQIKCHNVDFQFFAIYQYFWSNLSNCRKSSMKNRSTILENLNKSETEQCLLNVEVVQRLHPDWRMVPHLPIFGWTEQHQELENYLNKKVCICQLFYFLDVIDKFYKFLELPTKLPMKTSRTLPLHYQRCLLLFGQFFSIINLKLVFSQ